jgi:hypothetical protein
MHDHVREAQRTRVLNGLLSASIHVSNEDPMLRRRRCDRFLTSTMSPTEYSSLLFLRLDRRLDMVINNYRTSSSWVYE